MKVYEVLHKNKILMGEFEKDESARIYTRKKYKHLWLKKGGEKFYFKERLPRKELYIGDVVAPYFFERAGLKSDEYLMYYLVEMETETGLKPGVLSRSYIGKHEFQLSYYDIALFCYCLDNDINYAHIKDDKILGLEHSSKIQRFEDTFKKNPGQYLVSADDMIADIRRFCTYHDIEVDIEDVAFKIKRMLIADFFLCQTDRHRGNTEFKIKHNKLSMCPIFDHEHCLSVGLLGKAYNMTKFPIYTGFSSIGAHKNTYEAESRYLEKSSIAGGEVFARSLRQNKDFMDTSRIFRDNGLMACDIILECMKDNRLRNFTYNFLCLDGQKVLDDFEKDYMKINMFIKQCMVDQFQTMQEKFALTFYAIDKHFKKSRARSAKFEALKSDFEQPLTKILGEVNRRNAEINPAKKTKSSLDEDYLLGLLAGH